MSGATRGVNRDTPADKLTAPATGEEILRRLTQYRQVRRGEDAREVAAPAN